jgi:hypothetical protein
MEPAELPVACSLTAEEQIDRAGELRELADRALVERRREAGRVVLRFKAGPAVEEQIEDLARRERECCPFLEISVERDEDLVALSIGAGPDADAALDAFYDLVG